MDILFADFNPSLRRFARWMVCCLLSIGLAACGGGDDDNGSATAPPDITAQPASVNVNPGGVATFSVTAAGGDRVTYQWLKNGAPIDGATSTTYTTPVITAADNGAQFAVVVANPLGTSTSTAATLTVGPAVAPAIVTQPASTSVVAGQTASFSAVVTGTAPLTYQWTKNGAALAGATASSYTTPATAAADSGAVFAVTITNAGGAATSANATLTVTPAATAPVIATQPANATVNSGQTATFSVVATGTAPFTYQWRKNGAAITGATTASYTTPATADADSGATFSVVVGNSAGTATSGNAALTVTAAQVAPAITAQPANVSVTAGQAASFSVAATGSAPLAYQWRRGGVAIAGATSATYTLSTTATSDNGAQFTVTVSNAAGSVASSPSATLTVGAAVTPVVITTQPADRSVVVGQTATFSVVASGTSPISYQWRKNGAAIAGATAASYTTPATIAGDTGAVFSVVVNNPANAATTSSNATLTVTTTVDAPAVTTQPASITVFSGATATFSVTATGTAPLAYQWRKNGVDIAGATSASYTTPATTFSDDQSSFTVSVSNASPTVATSNAAVLTVTLAPSAVRQVAAGFRHSMALRESGAVYTWSEFGNSPSFNALAGAGSNAFSQGSTVRARNVDNTPFLGVAGISAGRSHSLVIRTDGTVWAWGYAGSPSFGECPMGDGACTTRFYPVQAKDASGVPFAGAAQVSAGAYFSVAVKTDGTVWSWGDNNYGTLGDSTMTDRLNPVQVIDPTTGGFFTGASQVAASESHVLALKANGTVWAWGRANEGQIGDGSVTSLVAVPKQVEVTPGVPLTGVVAIAAGEFHSVALKADGTVHAWGRNNVGALGDGTTSARTRATAMRDVNGAVIGGITAIAAGSQFSVLLKLDGTVLTTGENDIGQLGDNSTAGFQINPVFVRDAAGTVFGGVSGISAAYRHTVVKRTDGTVWAWGLNSSYQLGDTTTVNRRNPVPAPANTP